MMRQHDDAMTELAALYAIGALERDEAAVAREHLATCEICRSEFVAARKAALALAASAATPPPRALRERVLNEISKAPRSNVIPLWRRPVALVAVAAAVILIAVWSNQLRHPSAVERVWAATCAPAQACSNARVVAAGAFLRLEAHGLAQPPKGKVYQTWIIPPASKPVPEPVLAVDSAGNATVEIPAGPRLGMLVAVTIEPEGGSQSPTTKPFLVATLN